MRVVSFEDRSARTVLRQVRASRNVLGIVPADAVDARVRVLTVGGRHPLSDPKAYPLEVESDRPVPKVTTMTVVGDIMVARRVGRAIADDPWQPFRPLAKRLADGLAGIEGVQVEAPQTNIVFVDLAGPARAKSEGLIQGLAAQGVLATGLYRLRFATHLDVDEAGIDRAVAAIREFFRA